MTETLTKTQIETRKRWVSLLEVSSATFSQSSAETMAALSNEITSIGVDALLGHLRFCGTIPESYKHDSTVEKAYSKYSDSVLAETLEYLGLTATIIDQRADVADVEAVAESYALVADAKVFRMTRTAKNAKDFKVDSMDRWKYGKDYTLLVAPIDHFPISNSKIYYEATSKSVCILSW